MGREDRNYADTVQSIHHLLVIDSGIPNANQRPSKGSVLWWNVGRSLLRAAAPFSMIGLCKIREFEV